ncbi:hypothetical protein OAE07_02745 [Winogradskyella sp.]|nr:hypothetical protein [Winogradskyella sp.]MDC0006873.1 hypothetical protein [Winogradskyella sp.]MDC1503662.1 hypothetical protein [Winogradskyella sp.]
MKVKTIIYIICIAFVFYSCNENKKTEKAEPSKKESEVKESEVKDLDYHLSNSLSDIENDIFIYNQLSDDVILNGFAFYKNEENDYTLIMQLNDEVTEDIIKQYTFGLELHVYEKDKQYLLPYSKSKNRLYDLRPFKPELIIANGHKYVTSRMKLKMRSFYKIVFYLYPRSGYAGKILGNKLKQIDYNL